MKAAAGLRLFLAGLLVAAWSVMCGIGGGLFAVPILHYLHRLPMRESVATALGLVAVSTVAATVSEALHDESALHWGVVGALAAGSLIGAQLGFRVARRLDARKLKMIFALLVLFVGLRLLLVSGAERAADAAGGGLGAAHYCLAALIGFGAGFVSPILGIGGGLVAVPALFFGLPSLGYLGARACSLAMAVVNSTRSLALYLAAREVDLARAAWLGLGAGLGAVLGVELVHLPGLETGSRVMMGVTLLFLSGRFAWDAWGPRARVTS